LINQFFIFSFLNIIFTVAILAQAFADCSRAIASSMTQETARRALVLLLENLEQERKKIDEGYKKLLCSVVLPEAPASSSGPDESNIVKEKKIEEYRKNYERKLLNIALTEKAMEAFLSDQNDTKNTQGTAASSSDQKDTKNAQETSASSSDQKDTKNAQETSASSSDQKGTKNMPGTSASSSNSLRYIELKLCRKFYCDKNCRCVDVHLNDIFGNAVMGRDSSFSLDDSYLVRLQ